MTLPDQKSKPLKKTSRFNQVISIIGQEVFQASLVTYLLLTLAETFREGFVSNFFNMNYLLLVVLVIGVAMVLTEPQKIIPQLRRRASRATIVLAIRTHKREQLAANRQGHQPNPTTPLAPQAQRVRNTDMIVNIKN